jgi:hypothetical protein
VVGQPSTERSAHAACCNRSHDRGPQPFLASPSVEAALILLYDFAALESILNR